MKNLFRANIVIAVCLLATACGQALQVTSHPVSPTPTATTIPSTATPIPSSTATIEPTHRPPYTSPTPIPTIDPSLLRNTFSIQTLNLNGYNAQLITGWDRGFGGGRGAGYCDGYYWLDANHLLLYPTTGQMGPREGYEIPVDAAWQPIVVNLETGIFWFPPVNTSSLQSCKRVYWSRDLGVLINSGIYEETPAVFTHTFDGKNLAKYRGKFTQVSPSNEKIIIDNNILIDLRTNSRTTLAWSLEEYEEEQMFSEVFWTADETRLYRCCYFYADLTKGISHRFTESDFLDRQGNQIDYKGLWLYRGEWVQNDSYFLAEWSWGEDGDIRYLPMFDPATRTIFDVRRLAGISNDWTCYQTIISHDGKYVWMVFGNGSYLIDLLTFEARFYAGINYVNPRWSIDSQFIWIHDSDSTIFSLLSISDKALIPLPVNPAPETEHVWHPTDKLVVYPARDKNALIFLDASTMSVQELPFKDQNSRYKISDLAWNPNGDKLIFITEDHILWQVDYPSLENLEQIMASANTIGRAEWSPDGESISFLNGSDIYIVDTVK